MTGMKDTGEIERRNGEWYPVFVPCKRPVACVWLNDGNQSDLLKAKSHAKKEGYTVFTYPVSEPDPLDLAKSAVMA